MAEFGPTIIGVPLVLWLVWDWVRFERKVKLITRIGQASLRRR